MDWIALHCKALCPFAFSCTLCCCIALNCIVFHCITSCSTDIRLNKYLQRSQNTMKEEIRYTFRYVRKEENEKKTWLSERFSISGVSGNLPTNDPSLSGCTPTMELLQILIPESMERKLMYGNMRRTA